MSEDVKPQIWIIFKSNDQEAKLIELEPTLQLMKEMGDVLNHYLELRPNHDDGAKAFLVLEKYRKFLESIHEKN